LLGSNCWEFLLGVGAAYLFQIGYQYIKPGIGSIAALLSCLLLFIISITYNDPASYIVYGILSFFVVFFSTTYEKNSVIHHNIARLFKVLGDASYAIYLFAPIVTIAINPKDNLTIATVIAVTICFSILFNQIIENNFLNWSRKRLYWAKAK
jgi:peptidoglycan/LPS O-acetylase OafA/YrhL